MLKNYQITAYLQIGIGSLAILAGIIALIIQIMMPFKIIEWWTSILGIFGGILAIIVGRDRLKHPKNYNSRLW